MKLLFAHDHTFYKYKDVMYSTGGLSKIMLERYTKVFENVTVISRQKELDEYEEKLTIASTDKVKFVPVLNFKSIKSFHNIITVRKLVEREILSSDCVIARLPSSIGNVAVEMAKKHNIPYLIEVVACPWDSLWNHSIQGKFIAPISYLKLKALVKDAPYVIYVTREFLQKRYPTNGKHINCSNVSLQEISEKTLSNRIRKINEKKIETSIILGTIGAVNVKHKGQQYIIEALGKLKKLGVTNYEYQLVGGGNQEYLKKIAKEVGVTNQVKFLGLMSHAKIFEWLEEIDIYTQPSRQEGLPRALIEAMSKALPAIGANTAGIPELIDRKYIFSNSSKNVEEIVNILTMLDKKSEVEQAKRNFEESKKYDKNLIEERRTIFLNQFRSEVR